MENQPTQPAAVYGLFLTKDREGSELLGVYTSHIKACLAAKLYIDYIQCADKDLEGDVEPIHHLDGEVQIRFLDLDQDPDDWFAVQARKLPFTYA